MSLTQFLILQRVFTLAALMIEKLDALIPGNLPPIDAAAVVDQERFKTDVALVDGWSILVVEIYQIEDYALTIEYCYLLRNPPETLFMATTTRHTIPTSGRFRTINTGIPRISFARLSFPGDLLIFSKMWFMKFKDSL